MNTAAMLVTQKVKPGREDDFRAWERQMAQAARDCPGFQGIELFAPAPPLQEEWVVLVRFDSPEHLQGWLHAETRARLLEEGADIFREPPTQVAMAAPRASAVISTRVSAHKADEFRAWQARMEAAEQKFPGYQGTELYPPVPGISEHWTVLFRFDSDEHLQAWLDSDVRKQLIQSSEEEFRQFDLQIVGSSFAGWFTPGGATTPPRWKQALVVLLGLFPTVMTVSALVGRLQLPVPFAAHILINNTICTILLTWLVMPLVDRFMAWWLFPRPGSARSVAPLGVLVILVGLAVALAAWWGYAP